jgi:hypothetical protein
MFVCHKCDNPACVNPDHLFLGTHVDNMRDMTSKGRAHKAGPKGEAHGRAKLTRDDVLAIRTDMRSDRTVAKEYGISLGNVNKIKNLQIWKHI